MSGSANRLEAELEIQQEQRRHHEHEAPGERALRHLDGVVAQKRQLAGEHGVERPHGRGRHGQRVAHDAARAQPLPADEDDARHGQREPGEEHGMQLLVAQQQRGQQRREERVHRHDHAHVAGRGVGERDVLEQEVQHHAREAGRRHERLLAPAAQLHVARAARPQHQEPDEEAVEQYLDGREVHEQHLRGHERRAPHHHGEEREQVPPRRRAPGRPRGRCRLARAHEASFAQAAR